MYPHGLKIAIHNYESRLSVTFTFADKDKPNEGFRFLVKFIK